MTDEDYMRQALKEGQKAKQDDKIPIATIIVKNGAIISSGISQVTNKLDPSAHGDMECIRNACSKLNSLDLTGCIMYTVIEPCAMCATCAGWAGISKIIFGAYKEDIPDNSYLISNYHLEDFSNNLTKLDGLKIGIKGGILREECKQVMENVKDWVVNSK